MFQRDLLNRRPHFHVFFRRPLLFQGPIEAGQGTLDRSQKGSIQSEESIFRGFAKHWISRATIPIDVSKRNSSVQTGRNFHNLTWSPCHMNFVRVERNTGE